MSNWVSCCRGRRSKCPAVLVDCGDLLIRDDYGSVVKIPLDAIQDLVTVINEAVAAGSRKRNQPPYDDLF